MKSRKRAIEVFRVLGMFAVFAVFAVFGGLRRSYGARWDGRGRCTLSERPVAHDSPSSPPLIASRFLFFRPQPLLLCHSFNGILIVPGFIIVVEEGRVGPLLFPRPFLSRWWAIVMTTKLRRMLKATPKPLLTRDTLPHTK